MRHVRRRTGVLLALILTTAAAAGGCGGGASAPPSTTPEPGPGIPEAAADTTATPAPPPGTTAVVTGWRYRFDMIAPTNERNAITDRWVYLWFWPDTSRVSFRLENRQGTPIKILWDDCRFTTTDGRTFKVVHEGITYERRNDPLNYTMVAGGERVSDWFAPVDLLEDPSAQQGRGMRLLFPTDVSAQSFVGKTFGASLVLEIEGQPRSYDLVFKVASVIPPS